MNLKTSEITVALISTTATFAKSENIAAALHWAEQSVRKGAQWICLPEMFSYHGPYDKLWDHAESEDGPLNEALAKFAKKHQVVLFAGSAPERPNKQEKSKVYNTQYVFTRDGSILAKYRKTHLFNLRDESGASLYCESDGYLAGNDLQTVEVDGWFVGLATCYDLRFPAFFQKLTESKTLDALVVPAAFTFQTGVYHWHLLLRARAVEHLCYVLAANQVGTHSPGKQSFGHSILVDPWGTVLCDSGHLPGLVSGNISKDHIRACRGKLPALDNRRPELYR